jgi:recombination protein RecT
MSQSQEIALRQATSSAVSQLQDDDFTQQIELAVPEGVSPRQLLRAAATAVLENPDLAAQNLRATLLQATLKCAQDGLLPDGRDAAFVIYKSQRTGDKVQYQPMIGGLRRIAADHGWSIQTHVVHEHDQFAPDFDENRANFQRAPLGQERGDPIGAYALGQHRDGHRMLEVMDLSEVDKVRKVSRTKDRGPWVDWWEQMAEKTVGRRLFKKLALDPKDRRVTGVLKALREEDAADTLYGSRGELVKDPDVPAAASGKADRQGEADAAAADAASSAGQQEEIEEGEFEVLHEPSDEELEALGSDGDEPVAEEGDGEFRFDRGKYEGKTFSEVYAQGAVGIGYLRWALRDWPKGDLTEALEQFAAEHDLAESE